MRITSALHFQQLVHYYRSLRYGFLFLVHLFVLVHFPVYISCPQYFKVSRILSIDKELFLGHFRGLVYPLLWQVFGILSSFRIAHRFGL